MIPVCEPLITSRDIELVIHPNENVGDVNYRMFIRDKASGSGREINETHRMRHLFQPEVKLILTLSGFETKTSEEWWASDPLSMSS